MARWITVTPFGAMLARVGLRSWAMLFCARRCTAAEAAYAAAVGLPVRLYELDPPSLRRQAGVERQRSGTPGSRAHAPGVVPVSALHFVALVHGGQPMVASNVELHGIDPNTAADMLGQTIAVVRNYVERIAATMEPDDADRFRQRVEMASLVEGIESIDLHIDQYPGAGADPEGQP